MRLRRGVVVVGAGVRHRVVAAVVGRTVTGPDRAGGLLGRATWACASWAACAWRAWTCAACAWTAWAWAACACASAWTYSGERSASAGGSANTVRAPVSCAAARSAAAASARRRRPVGSASGASSSGPAGPVLPAPACAPAAAGNAAGSACCSPSRRARRPEGTGTPAEAPSRPVPTRWPPFPRRARPP